MPPVLVGCTELRPLFMRTAMRSNPLLRQTYVLQTYVHVPHSQKQQQAMDLLRAATPRRCALSPTATCLMAQRTPVVTAMCLLRNPL